MGTTEAPRARFARPMSVWAGTVVGVSGTVVLVVGWFLGVDAFRSVLPGLVTMKANTAVGFVLFGIAANPLVRERHRMWSDLAASLLLALGVATMLQYLTGISLGIDELLVDDPTATGDSVPGRPGLNTAVGFALLGLGSLAGDHRNRGPVRVVAQGCAFAVQALSVLALLGYLLGVTQARGIGSATEMALHTAVLFVVASVGLAAKTADVGLLTVLVNRADTGRSARVLLPSTVVASLVGVGAVEVLAAAGLLEDVRLQLALTATVSLAVVAVTVLVAMEQLAQAEARADADRAELAAVRSAFPDVHVRIDDRGRVAAVHGDVLRVGLHGLVRGLEVGALGDLAGGDVLRDGVARCRRERRLVGATYQSASTDAAFEARFVPFGDGEVAVAVRDVSDLAAAQHELEQLNENLEAQVVERTAELERTNREMERFAYLASHDLQEPLRMVTGFVSRIGERYGDQLDERGQQYVHFAVDGAERMKALIDGLLAYSRAGRLDPERVRRTELGEVVRDVVDVSATSIRETDADVRLDLAPAAVAGDPSLLRQVVQNLLGNALRYARPGVAPVVTVATATSGDEVVLRVEDNGVGIPAERREAVFEMFRRFDDGDGPRGAGIGLSLVTQVVHAHGGSVTVDDADGGSGTRFTVRLPREVSDE